MSDFKISLQQIEIFLTVARCQSISTAAQKLYISQPAVSKWLHEMEDTLGKQLLIRTNRGISLSPDGEVLYADLHPVYHKFRVTLERMMMTEDAANHLGTLHVGALHDPETIYSMYAFLGLANQRYPDLDISSELYSFQELREKLLYGELDLVFTFSTSETEPLEDLDRMIMYSVDRFFWFPAEWDMPIEKLTDLQFLSDKNLLLEMHGNNSALTTCRAHGFEPADVKYASSFLLLSYLISHGEGFTVWSRYCPETFKDRIRILPFLTTEGVPETNIIAVWRRRDTSENLLKALEVARDPILHKPEKNPLQKGAKSRW
jgi:DNA-binding transcriptional LysR family regulator